MSEQTEQSYRRRVIRGLVDVIKCGLCEKIGMLELYLHSSFQRAVEVEVESRLRQMKDLAAVRANIDAADIQVSHQMVQLSNYLYLPTYSSLDVGSCCTSSR
jgi:hypothetical protein